MNPFIKSIIALFIIFFIHTMSYANIPGDIDKNGRLNLKDCLQLINKIAGLTNENSINLIQAPPLIEGTYSQIRNSEKTTYTFNDDGTCIRVGPDNFGGELITEGTWHYENESLFINTSGKLVIYVATYQINIDEYYKAAFTNEDASKLIMAPPGKSMDQMPDILGRYMGSGEVFVTLPDMPYGNQTITIESIIDVEPDGSWESAVTIDTNGKAEIDKTQGVIDPSMPTLYVFGDTFYPDIFSSDTESAYFVRE